MIMQLTNVKSQFIICLEFQWPSTKFKHASRNKFIALSAEHMSLTSKKIILFDIGNNGIRGYSSVVEHSTADREVPGSNPGAP